MADIQQLTYPFFTDGTTPLNASNLNQIVAKINELVVKVNGGVTPTQTVATPTISISGTTATISCATAGATIYYTTNGNTPTTSSTQYSSPITLSGACTIKAIAVKSGMTNSQIASAEYNPSATVQPPTIYIRDFAIIMDAESGASIYYTTDGSTPTANSTQYTGAFTSATNISSLKAVAIKNGTSSSVASASFTAPQTSTSERPMVVVEGNKATILSNGVGTLMYALDDSTDWQTYSAPVTLSSACIFKARVKDGSTNLYTSVDYTGNDAIVASVRYAQSFASTKIVRANSTDSALALNVSSVSSSNLRFWAIVQGRKYAFKCTLGIAANGYWGYASQIPQAITEAITITGKYDSSNPIPDSSNPKHDFSVTAENYAYLVTDSSATDYANPFAEIIK